MTSNIVFWAIAQCVFLLALLMVLAAIYARTMKGEAFVRTGLGGERVIVNGGAMKLPFFHELVRVNLRLMKLTVVCKDEDALITATRQPINLKVDFYVQVKVEPDAIALAARLLAEKTLQSTALLQLLRPKLVDALQTLALGKTPEEFLIAREDGAKELKDILAGELGAYGLQIESIAFNSFAGNLKAASDLS